MDNTKYTYPTNSVTLSRPVASAPSPWAAGGFGMIVGATASAAANIRRLNNQEIDRGQAMKNVIRDAAGAGVATATAAAVVGAFRLGGLFNLAGILAVGTATKYLYDTAFEPQSIPAETSSQKPASTAKPAPKAKVKPVSKTKPAPKAKPAEKKED